MINLGLSKPLLEQLIAITFMFACYTAFFHLILKHISDA
jgi:hypothetical protein